MSSSTNVYLTAVALCDLHYLLFSCLFSLWIYKSMHRVAIYAYSITFIHGTANLFSNTTTWLTVCFTMERYVAVSFPMLGRRICTQKRARYAVIAISLVSLLFTFPDYLKYRVIIRGNYTTEDNRTVIVYGLEESEYLPYLVAFGYDYFNQIIFVLIPMLLLILFNSLLIRSVLKANKGRKGLVQHTGSDRGNREFSSLRERGTYSETYQRAPVMVKEALGASIRATVELTTNITQSFTQPGKLKVQPSTHSRRPILGEQHRITLMLITIVIAFVILQLPSIVPTIQKNLSAAGVLEETPFLLACLHIYSNFSNVLLIINAAMNFVFYSLFSAKFRQTFCMLFQRCQCSEIKTQKSTTTSATTRAKPTEMDCLLTEQKPTQRSHAIICRGAANKVAGGRDPSEQSSAPDST
ncbi:unnamed protein product [Calicophoron daubneyi]|uniref:G-protein coupled receptors family 1 profile domain-containing protein n=1 Tax=Calicophoron daubneyi TaxID=300641 RepID=A0AAV2TCI6_CALDB